MKKIILPAFLALCVISACRNVPSNPGNKDTTTCGDSSLISAVDGLVLKGPISPVQRIGVPNEAPLSGARISFSVPYAMIAPIVVTSDSVGQFSVKLSAGTYTVTCEPFPNLTFPRPPQDRKS